MSYLAINVQNEDKKGQDGISVACEFYIQYVNASTSKTITSNVLADLQGTTEVGQVGLLSSKVSNTRDFTKYWERFQNENLKAMAVGTSFKIIASAITSPTSTFASSVEVIQFDLTSSKGKLEKSKDGYYALPSKTVGNKAITLLSKDNSKVDLATLEKNFKEAESSYVKAKRIYEENLKVADTSKIFEQLTDNEPSKFAEVITRMLEFEESTLDAGLRFTKKTNLTEEFKRLDMIKTSILVLKNLYPDLKLSDGEGLPYSK